MNRQAMIERLVEDDIQTIKDAMQNRDIEYLDFILRSGWMRLNSKKTKHTT